MKACFKLTCCLVLVAGLLLINFTREVAATQSIEFARDIKPIFDANCVSCHGAKKAAGQLRLDTLTVTMRGGISGAIIIPKDSKGSILLARITGSDGQAAMPMGGDPLKPEHVELIRKWIEEGARGLGNSEESRNPKLIFTGLTSNQSVPPFLP